MRQIKEASNAVSNERGHLLSEYITVLLYNRCVRRCTLRTMTAFCFLAFLVLLRRVPGVSFTTFLKGMNKAHVTH